MWSGSGLEPQASQARGGGMWVCARAHGGDSMAKKAVKKAKKSPRPRRTSGNFAAPTADQALKNLLEGNKGALSKERSAATPSGERRWPIWPRPAPLRNDPRLQRFARAARMDFRCRPGRAVRRARGRQHSLAGDCGEPAVRGIVSADAVVRGARPRRMRGDCRGAGHQAGRGAVSFAGSTARGEHRPWPAGSRSETLPGEQLSRAVESNVRWTVRQILDSPEGTGAGGRRAA